MELILLNNDVLIYNNMQADTELWLAYIWTKFSLNGDSLLDMDILSYVKHKAVVFTKSSH